MKQCKENLNKLKSLCDQLTDRDSQLKINAKALWMVVEEVDKVKQALESGGKLSDLSEMLNNVSVILEKNNCKRLEEHE